jgi:hypothetical protein
MVRSSGSVREYKQEWTDTETRLRRFRSYGIPRLWGERCDSIGPDAGTAMTDQRDPTPHVEELRTLSDEDGLFGPISTERRRTVIRYLSRLSPDATVCVEELARVCAAVEQDESLDTLGYTDYRRAIGALHQRDLTHLAIEDVLNTRDKAAINRSERFEKYAAVLDTIDTWLE